MPPIARIRIRRDPASTWTSVNPILMLGEAGYETDTRQLKIGDGLTAWSGLNYISGGSGLSIEDIEDTLGTSFLVNGTGIVLSYSDATDSLTINVDSAPKILTTVFNKTGSPISKFQAVYIDGGQGDLPTIALAIASGELTSSTTYGITAATINNMSSGNVIVIGALNGVDTDQFNPTAPTGNVNGTTLYLSPTISGGITTTKPLAPNNLVTLGTIVRTHQNQGVVEVRVQNGFELEELHDVKISGVSNGQTIIYNSGTSLWTNSTISAGSGIILNYSSDTLTISTSGVSVLSPTAISTSQNNYNPGTGDVFRISASVSGVNLTGMVPGSEKIRLLLNIGSTHNITLVHESSSSTAANRFITPNASNYIVAPTGSATLFYDDASTRWRVL